MLNCNNNIKLLTNGSDTKHTMWYSTMYQSKKQGKNYNLSALMVKAFMYHDSKHDSDEMAYIEDHNRVLLFRCEHAINQEMELSAWQVILYLMNWGDCFCSH